MQITIEYYNNSDKENPEININPDILILLQSILFQKSRIYWDLGETDKAISIAEEVCLQAPDWDEPIAQLGRWYYHNKNWKASAEKFKMLESQHSASEETSDRGNFSQFFVDTGEGFSETKSIKQPISLDSNTQPIEFDLSNFKDAQKSRFDPIDDSVIVKIVSAHLVHKNKKNQKISFHYSI